ncbi:MAG: carbamoyl phosphate synthase small subunit, partial [Bacteroidia bacterium]|nr:carbamoyl phosphate synthase small subunit [Bacteroidia bacterium]
MKYIPKQPAVLLLEDGKVFHGKAAGKIGTTAGEICFNTGMTGYQEIFTDPSYFGQITVMTNVHIGNYGVNDDEVESDSIKIAGMVCKSFNEFHSRKRSNGSIKEYFENDNIVAIQGVDTRAIVRYIRSKGAMNAIISSEELDITKLKAKLAKVPSMVGLELSSKVSTQKPYFFGKA